MSFGFLYDLVSSLRFSVHFTFEFLGENTFDCSFILIAIGQLIVLHFPEWSKLYFFFFTLFLLDILFIYI